MHTLAAIHHTPGSLFQLRVGTFRLSFLPPSTYRLYIPGVGSFAVGPAGASSLCTRGRQLRDLDKQAYTKRLRRPWRTSSEHAPHRFGEAGGKTDMSRRRVPRQCTPLVELEKGGNSPSGLQYMLFIVVFV